METLTIKSTGYENLFDVAFVVDGTIKVSGYVSKYKIVPEKDYVGVFTYKDSEFHNYYFTVNEVCENGRKILPLKSRVQEWEPSSKFYNVWLFPDSSNISMYKYDPKNKVLSIVFRSDQETQYNYIGVSRAVFIEMLESGSKGTYYSRNIKYNPEYGREEIEVGD